MNRDYVLFHLREAQREIGDTIAEIDADPSYEFGDFLVAITHLYHHINTAWNARDSSESRAKACSESDFRRWRQFPADIDLSV